MRHDGIVPASDDIERDIEPIFQRELFQFEDMFLSRARAPQRILIFQLNADDRTAILPKHPGELLCHFLIPMVNGKKVCRIVDTGWTLRKHPVWQSAIAHLGMVPRTDSRNEQHSMLSAQLGKCVQIALS